VIYRDVVWTVEGLAEETELNGTVTFTATPRSVAVSDAVTPFTVLPAPVTRRIVNGRLTDDDGASSVALVTTDDPDAATQAWTYRAEWALDDGVTFGTFVFDLPAAAAPLDLTEMQPVDESSGVPILRGPQGEPGPVGPHVISIIGQSGEVDATELAAGLDTSGNRLSSQVLQETFTSKILTTNYAMRPEQSERLGGNQNITVSIIGIDETANVIFAVNTSNTRVIQSDNYGTTWSAARTLPADVTWNNVTRIVRFGAYVYMLAKTTADNLIKVFRATPVAQGANWADWSTPLLTLAAGTTAFSFAMEASKWGTGTEYLFVAEYGDPVGGPSIHRTADGITWSRVHGPDATMRHIHHVMPDPFNPGHVWATCGDGVSKTIMRSTNSGSTWTTAIASAAWQAVQISFTEDYVWMAADSRQGTAFVIDRATNTPYHASPNYHHHTVPPSGTPARSVTDGAVTSGSVTVTSATANFTAADLGKYIANSNVFPPFTRIQAINSATSVQASAAANFTGTGRTLNIGSDLYYANAYCGAIDPATGIYYCAAMDTSNAGTTMGLFYIPRLGERAEILDPGGSSISMNTRVYMLGGYLFCGQWRRPLLAAALPPS
jgi:hypothetical protein